MKAKVLLLTAMLVSMALAGCLDDGDDEPDYNNVTLNLSPPKMEPRVSGNWVVWDVTIIINKITPRDTDVRWKDLEVFLKSPMGSFLVQPTKLNKDTGIYGDTPQFWYIENGSGSHTLDMNDSIKITTIDTDYAQATFQINAKDNRIGSLTLPTDFPYPPPTSVSLSPPQLSQKYDNASLWNIRLDIHRISPKNAKALWTEVKILIKASDGHVLDAATDLMLDIGRPYANTTAFYYVETTYYDNYLSAEDGIKIIGIDRSYESATVELIVGSERIAAATLPTYFP